MKNHPASHTGHAGNSGIQNHSIGDHYPVRSYCIGSADHRVAEFCGVRRDSFDADGHANDLRRMKHAEVITDAIFAARAEGTGCSSWLGGIDAPGSGYVVGLEIFESRFDCTGPNYREVYADVVQKLEWVECAGTKRLAVCIGSWIHDDELYVDVGTVYDDLDEAINAGVSNNQISIWDLAEDRDIFV